MSRALDGADLGLGFILATCARIAGLRPGQHRAGVKVVRHALDGLLTSPVAGSDFARFLMREDAPC